MTVAMPTISSSEKAVEVRSSMQSGSLIHQRPCMAMRQMELRTMLRAHGRFHLS